jgi:hypothetical protein
MIYYRMMIIKVSQHKMYCEAPWVGVSKLVVVSNVAVDDSSGHCFG